MGEDVIIMPTIICPKCRSSNVRRSRTHGVKESFSKLFGKKAYRCRDCGWRGLILAPNDQSKRATKQKSYVFAVIFGIIILALIYIFNFRAEQIEKIIRMFLGTPK